MSNTKNDSPKASIWKSKSEKLVETAPHKTNTASSSKKTTASSSKNQSRKKSEKKEQKVMFQPKLMTEEDAEKKTCLIKISMRTSIRQVINYGLDKIRKDWTVTFNAFQADLTKALQACEIIKTRVPFLYQENKFISWEVPIREKETTGEKEGDEGSETLAEDNAKKESSKRIRTGLSITLSKKQFEVTNMAGYQKPKPRQFLQPLPAKAKPVLKDESEDDKVQKKKKGGRNRPRSAQKSQRASKIEENKENSNGRRKRGSKKKQFQEDSKSHSEEKRRYSSQDEYEYHHMRSSPRDYYHGYRDDSRRRYGKVPHHTKNFDSDFEKPRAGGYGKMMYRPDSDRFHNDYPPTKGRGPVPRYGGGNQSSSMPFRERQFRNGPPAHSNMRYQGFKAPMSRGSDFDKPDRPGYYAGSHRPFRMDKMRSEPLERDERPGPHSGKEFRDQRNRPAQMDRR